MKNNKKKISVVAICLLLTVVLAVGGTLAYLFTTTLPVENTFQPARVGNYVEETFDGVTKTNVKVENSVEGDTTEVVNAYIRATYVVTWQKSETKEGKTVKYMKPADADDYTVSLNLDSTAPGDVTGKWIKFGDYYYFTGVVAPGNTTDVLINSISPVNGAAPAGYNLHVEILSQSIQAEGTNDKGETPAQLKWGVTISANSVAGYTPQP